MDQKELQETWALFAEKQGLSDQQILQFRRYFELLNEWNDRVNITAIDDLEKILAYHFEDSLALDQFVDMHSLSITADVGTGGGFPGLPLKIKYPHLQMILIEVNQKKRDFLNCVKKELDLKEVIIYPHDWRTFIRKTDFAIDLFCSRASLHPDELLRIYKPSCVYQKAQMVYWASEQWVPQEKEKEYIQKEERYIVGQRNRRLIFLHLTN